MPGNGWKQMMLGVQVKVIARNERNKFRQVRATAMNGLLVQWNRLGVLIGYQRVQTAVMSQVDALKPDIIDDQCGPDHQGYWPPAKDQ